MPKNEGFACTQCGACCRRIARIAELARFDDGSGICKYLDKSCNIMAINMESIKFIIKEVVCGE